MGIFYRSFKKFSLLEFSCLLCFLLPPIGIFILLLIGLQTIYKQWLKNKRFIFSLSTYFFLCLFISTIGATIFMKDITYICISLLILSYWGLYIRILEAEKYKLFQHFRLIMIFGGVYSCVIGWISKLYTLPLTARYIMGTILFGKNEPKDYNRLIGCAYNPNFTVFILLIAISFLFSYLLSSFRSQQKARLVWQILVLILLSSGVIQTGSRAGFASMILIYLLFLFRLNKLFFFFGITISLPLCKWFVHLMPRAESVIQAGYIRQDIWKATLKIWQDHPFFGVTPIGFGQEYFKHFNEFVPHAHNMILGMFAEYGTLGGVAFLLLFVINLLKCTHLFLSIRSKKYIVDSYLLALPIILFTGIFDEPLFSPQIGFLVVILFASWDKFMKRINYFIAFPSLTKINDWIYVQLSAPRIKHN